MSTTPFSQNTIGPTPEVPNSALNRILSMMSTTIGRSQVSSPKWLCNTHRSGGVCIYIFLCKLSKKVWPSCPAEFLIAFRLQTPQNYALPGGARGPAFLSTTAFEVVDSRGHPRQLHSSALPRADEGRLRPPVLSMNVCQTPIWGASRPF